MTNELLQSFEQYLDEKHNLPFEHTLCVLKEIIQQAIEAEDVAFICDELLHEIADASKVGSPIVLISELEQIAKLLRPRLDDKIIAVYLLMAQSYYYCGAYSEAKKFYKLVMSKAMEYKQYKRLAVAINNYIACSDFLGGGNEVNQAHLEEITKLIPVISSMDVKLSDPFIVEMSIEHIETLIRLKKFTEAKQVLARLELNYDVSNSDRLQRQLQYLHGLIHFHLDDYEKAYEAFHELVLYCIQHKCHYDLLSLSYHFIRQMKKYNTQIEESGQTFQTIRQSLEKDRQYLADNGYYFNKLYDTTRMVSTEELAFFKHFLNEHLNMQGKPTSLVCIELILSRDAMIDLERFYYRLFELIEQNEMLHVDRKLHYKKTSIQYIMTGIESEITAILTAIFDKIRQQLPDESRAIKHILLAVVGNTEYHLHQYEDCIQMANALIYSSLYK